MIESRRTGSVCWLVSALAFLFGCGDNGQLDTSGLWLERGAPSGIPVVFRVDYPDIYGPIDVQVRGTGNLTLQVEDRFNCNEPALFHGGGTLEFGALSHRYFHWREVVVPDEGTDCLVIDLSADKLRTSVAAYGIDFPYPCYPYTVSLKFGPHEMHDVWTIEDQQPLHADVLMERTDEHGLLALVDEARKGRLILIGGGYALVEPIVRFQSSDNPNSCPGWIDRELTGFSSLEIRIGRQKM